MIDLQKSDTWKIQVTIPINFISSKDTDEERTIYPKSDNIEVIIYDNPYKVAEELFDLLRSRYQVVLETRMKQSDFIFDCVNLSYYKFHKVNFKGGGSYIDSPDWIEKMQ